MKLSTLIELSAELDKVREFGRYDEDEGNRRMLTDAAIGAGGLAATGVGGLYLRNRGDAASKAKMAEITKAGATPFVPGIKRAATEAEFAGGTGTAIGRGAKDLWKSIRSKISIPALARTVKASAKHENLVELDAIPTAAKIELSAELDEAINLDIGDGIAGAGIVGGAGAGLYGLHQRGARTALNVREKKMYGKLGSRVAGANIRVGAGQLLGDLAKKLR